jgi:hypothetical protein
MQTPLPPDIFSPGNVESIVIGGFALVATVVGFFLLKPLVLAFARRVEGRGADPQLMADVEQLREQVAELDPLRGRVQELEERVEFAERILADRAGQPLLPKQDRP